MQTQREPNNLYEGAGLVRSPIFTTVMQVASRFLIVWAFADQFPGAAAQNPAYSSMLIAWSVTEVIRYSYFVCLLTGRVPEALTWLRYSKWLRIMTVEVLTKPPDTTRSSCSTQLASAAR